MTSDPSPTIAKRLAKLALDLGAIKINPGNPFTWASGARMPIYNDNRLLLGDYKHRSLITDGFRSILEAHKIKADVIAGTATAGIPHATTLANALQSPLIYVRPSAKEHGMKNQIEGPLQKGQKVVVIEDLVSTGGSVLKVIKSLREAGAIVDHCLGIFSYGFQETRQRFVDQNCELHTLIDFEELLSYMLESGSLDKNQLQSLQDWRKNPFEWWEKTG